jgi:hypothetical protein
MHRTLPRRLIDEGASISPSRAEPVADHHAVVLVITNMPLPETEQFLALEESESSRAG